MFTGLAESVHGCTDSDRKLGNQFPTIATRLKQRGYATAGFFAGPYLHPVFGLGQGFDVYTDCTSYAEWNDAQAQQHGTIEGVESWVRSEQDITNPRLYERVSTWLSSAAQKNAPFFLFIHLWDVHHDYIPPPPYDTMFDPNYTGTIDGRNYSFSKRMRPDMPREDLNHIIALYDGEIAWTDLHVGKILADLSRLKLDDKTLLIVTADHGEAFFEHYSFSHRNSLFDEEIRIPLMIRFPHGQYAGIRKAEQVRIIDILPTILATIGVPADPRIMGQDLVPLLRDGKLQRDEPAISELLTMGHRLESARRPCCKVIFDEAKSTGMVFDLIDDPAEKRGVADKQSPIMQTVGADLRWSRQWISQFAKLFPAGQNTTTLPSGVQKQLESLGYAGKEEPAAPKP